MIEIWKDIKGLEGLYQISNLGRVKSLPKLVNSVMSKTSKRKTKEKILKPAIGTHGYLRFHLQVNYKAHHCLLHRLMAEAFIWNPENLEQVNHKDGNKLNNSIDNLEWVTRSENAIHSFKMGLSYQPKARSINVYTYPQRQFIAKFENMLAASKFTNVNRSNIYQIIKGKQKQGKGFTFELVDVFC